MLHEATPGLAFLAMGIASTHELHRSTVHVRSEYATNLTRELYTCGRMNVL